jgi:hypothetical protein
MDEQGEVEVHAGAHSTGKPLLAWTNHMEEVDLTVLVDFFDILNHLRRSGAPRIGSGALLNAFKLMLATLRTIWDAKMAEMGVGISA